MERRDDGHDRGSLDPGRPLAVARVIEQVRSSRAAGEHLDDPSIISAHPELMPELGHELDKLRRIEAAWAATSAGPAPAGEPPASTPVGPAEIELAKALAADLERPAIEVPGYTVLREIGRGGQAVVFLAFKLNPGRRVALKVMRDGSLADGRALARFKAEAGILADLNHPNIVTIFETGLTADGSHYFAMNYIAGCGLDEYMHQRQKTDPDPAKLLRLFFRICDIVNAAHVKQIVHRDLKPGNIRVDEHGEPHILDFGLARPAMDRSAGSEPVSVTGEFLGSLPWSSPEQAAGDHRNIDVRTDVYSLGVILYQMLTGGRFPYEVVGNIRDVLNNIVTSEPTPPSKVIAAGLSRAQSTGLAKDDGTRKLARTHPPAVNEAIERIVLKALAKQPDQRYQNAGELGSAIADYLQGRETSASGRGKTQRRTTGRTLRRIAAITAVAAALVGITLWQILPQAESPMKPSRLLKSLVLLLTTGVFGGPKPAAPDNAPPPARGLTIPDAATQAKKEKVVRDVFGNFNAAPLAERPAIAAKLIDQGMATADDPAARYVLLKDGGELAASAGDAATAMRAATLLASVYAVDAGELKLTLFRKAAGAATTPAAASAVAQEGVNCANEALASGNYDLASRFMLPTEQAAHVARDVNLILSVQSRAADIKWLQSESFHARTAEEKLNKTPTDPDANHTLGRYFCLVRGDWAHGLIGLSKGSNPAYHAAATADLANPTTTDKQVATGDLWWDIAEKETAGAAQRTLRRRAGYWYAQAVANPQFAGLSRALVEKRLGQIPPPGPGEAVAQVPAEPAPPSPVHGKWTPLAADGIPPGLVIADVDAGDVEADYVKFMSSAGENSSFHGRVVAPIHANSEGVFRGPGPKNIETSYYAFFVRNEAPQTVGFSLRTTEYGAVSVYVDGNQVLTHREDNHNKYETKLPLNLPAGDHVIVIRHRNGWAKNWIGVQFEGNSLLTLEALSGTPPLASGQRTPPGGNSAPNAVTNTLGMKLVRIEPGEFMMGSPKDEKHRQPGPEDETLHHVTITKPFLMATTTVTQAQWKALMGSNPSYYRAAPEGTTTPRSLTFAGKEDNLPVEQTSWNDAVLFCERLSAREGRHYRLPTEAEWEFACRAGTQTAFGDGSLDDIAWYAANSGKVTHEVATKKPNRWGLYDMIGNVWQWCSDGYGPYTGDAVDPLGSDDPSFRVNRGGSCVFDPANCRAAMRRKFNRGNRNSDVGFRVCLDTTQLPGIAELPPAVQPPPATSIDINHIAGTWINTRMSERYILKDDHTGGIMSPSGEIWTKFNWTFEKDTMTFVSEHKNWKLVTVFDKGPGKPGKATWTANGIVEDRGTIARKAQFIADAAGMAGRWKNTRTDGDAANERYVFNSDLTGEILLPNGEIWFQFTWTFDGTTLTIISFQNDWRIVTVFDQGVDKPGKLTSTSNGHTKDRGTMIRDAAPLPAPTVPPAFVPPAGWNIVPDASASPAVLSPAVATGNGAWIDLLRIIDSAKDAKAGSWKLENGVLTSNNANGARIQIPYVPPEEYDYRIVFSRNEGGSAVVQFASRQEHEIIWDIGRPNSRFVLNDKPTEQPCAVENGHKYVSLIKVRRGSVQFFLDDRLILEEKDEARLYDPGTWYALKDKRCLGIGSHFSPTSFYSVEVLEITGHERPTPSPGGNIFTDGPAPAAVADLTAQLNDPAHWKIQKGTWKNAANKLRGEGESEIWSDVPLPRNMALSFRMNVIQGSDPRMDFYHANLSFTNIGAGQNLFPVLGPTAKLTTPPDGYIGGTRVGIPYANNQPRLMTFKFGSDHFAVEIDGKPTYAGTYAPGPDIRLQFHGGGKSGGITEFSDFRVEALASSAAAPVGVSLPRPPAAGAGRAMVFLGNSKSVPFFAKFTGKEVVTVHHREAAAALANPDTFNNFNILVWEPNSLCWAKPELDDAIGERLARFVEKGGNLVIFAQVTKVNCDVIEKPFGIQLSYGGGAQGIVWTDPAAAARLKAAGFSDQQIADVRVIARAKMPPDKAVVLARSKFGPVADVMQFGLGRIIFIGGTLNGPISTVENGTDEAFDLALLDYLFDTGAAPAAPAPAPANTSSAAPSSTKPGPGGSIFGDTDVKK